MKISKCYLIKHYCSIMLNRPYNNCLMTAVLCLSMQSKLSILWKVYRNCVLNMESLTLKFWKWLDILYFGIKLKLSTLSVWKKFTSFVTMKSIHDKILQWNLIKSSTSLIKWLLIRYILAFNITIDFANVFITKQIGSTLLKLKNDIERFCNSILMITFK